MSRLIQLWSIGTEKYRYQRKTLRSTRYTTVLTYFSQLSETRPTVASAYHLYGHEHTRYESFRLSSSQLKQRKRKSLQLWKDQVKNDQTPLGVERLKDETKALCCKLR